MYFVKPENCGWPNRSAAICAAKWRVWKLVRKHFHSLLVSVSESFQTLENKNKKETLYHMKKQEKILLGIFIFIEIIIYGIFMYLDIIDSHIEISKWLKFIGVCICFFLSLIFDKIRKLNRYLLTSALFLTVLADVCLLLTDFYIGGVCFFFFVQSIYLFRLYKKGIVSSFLSSFLLRLSTGSIILLLVSVCLGFYDFLLGLSILYFVQIFHNVILAKKWSRQQSIASKKKKWEANTFFVGILLFLLCDIHVGIFNLGSYILVQNELIGGIIQFSSVAMWMFYLPAQVFITISGVLCYSSALQLNCNK